MKSKLVIFILQKQLDKKINSSVELSQPVKLFDDEDELIKDDLISLFKKSQQDI